MEKVLYSRKLHIFSAIVMVQMVVFYIWFMYQNGFNYNNLFAIILGLFCLSININTLKTNKK